MAVDPKLLAELLKTPETEGVTQSPIVIDLIKDPANADGLVSSLDADAALEVRNARLILCEFDSRAIRALFTGVSSAKANGRQQRLQVLWTLLATESASTIRESLQGVKDRLNLLLDDRASLPDVGPDYIEHDVRGRLCDLTYIVVQQLLSPTFDQSLFRSLDNAGRDREITTLKRSDLSDAVS